MRQVLFRIPPWSDTGLPIYGFGMMLFVTFIVCTWVAGRRGQKEGIAAQLFHDLAIWLFIGGIVGARIVYMIQYKIPFLPPWNFFKIWEGGLVFYGSFIGGAVACVLGYWFLFKKHGIPLLQVADILAPSIALGLAIGRVGCLLNGCCYGHVACDSCPIQLHFPLSAPPRFTLVSAGYQTAAGFTLAVPKDREDPLTVVGAVEPVSAAAEAGLKPGDVIVGIDGKVNPRILEVNGRRTALERLEKEIGPPTKVLHSDGISSRWQYEYEDLPDFKKALKAARANFLDPRISDGLIESLTQTRGTTSLELKVRREGEKEPVELAEFSPRTIGIHPTQVYESISTLLLFFVLCAYYPLRRHYGEVMVLFLFAYALHRFINEQLRNDTPPIFIGPIDTGMTLSQNGSIAMVVAGSILALYLWRRPADVPRETEEETPASAEPTRAGPEAPASAGPEGE